MTKTGVNRPTFLVAFIVSLVFVSCADAEPGAGGAQSERGAGGAQSSQPEPAGRIAFLAPGPLSEEMVLDELQGYELPREREEAGGYAAVVGTEQRDGEFTEIVDVTVGKAKEDREVGDDERFPYEMVDINGVSARFRDHEFTGAHAYWLQDGLAVTLIGPPGARDLVLAIARAIRLPESDDTTAVMLGPLPKGKQLVAERGHSAFQGSSYSVFAKSTRRDDTRTLSVHVQTAPEGTFDPATFVASDRFRYVTIRGATAALGSSTEERSVEGRSIAVDQTRVAWLEYPDVLVFILGVRIDEKELTAFAEGLEEVSEQEWRSRFSS